MEALSPVPVTAFDEPEIRAASAPFVVTDLAAPLCSARYTQARPTEEETDAAPELRQHDTRTLEGLLQVTLWYMRRGMPCERTAAVLCSDVARVADDPDGRSRVMRRMWEIVSFLRDSDPYAYRV